MVNTAWGGGSQIIQCKIDFCSQNSNQIRHSSWVVQFNNFSLKYPKNKIKYSSQTQYFYNVSFFQENVQAENVHV